MNHKIYDSRWIILPFFSYPIFMRVMAQIANDLSIWVFEAGNMADLG